MPRLLAVSSPSDRGSLALSHAAPRARRTNRGGRFDERRGSGSSNNAWGRARRAFSMGDDSPPRSQSSLPENCFCDMRGFACPRHRGREKWRQNHDYKIHVEHNIDSAASDAALGAGSTLAGSTFGKCLGSV